jgi:hypothetical protein
MLMTRRRERRGLSRGDPIINSRLGALAGKKGRFDLREATAYRVAPDIK